MQSIHDRQQVYINSKPLTMTNVYTKAFNGGRAAAIKAKCLDCTLDTREEVRNCEAYLCPLWAVRPYQRKDSVDLAGQNSVE